MIFFNISGVKISPKKVYSISRIDQIFIFESPIFSNDKLITLNIKLVHIYFQTMWSKIFDHIFISYLFYALYFVFISIFYVFICAFCLFICYFSDLHLLFLGFTLALSRIYNCSFSDIYLLFLGFIFGEPSIVNWQFTIVNWKNPINGWKRPDLM